MILIIWALIILATCSAVVGYFDSNIGLLIAGAIMLALAALMTYIVGGFI